MSTPINYLVLSYPNFALGQTIDPDEVNQNNTDITNKLNEFVDDVNLSLANSETATTNSTTAVSTASAVQTDYNTLKPLLEQARDDANYASTYIDEKVLASNQSMYRQAFINGNFDVWQRGINLSNCYGYSADRWQTLRASLCDKCDVSRQNSDLQGSTYHMRIQRKSADTYLNSIMIAQSLESSTSKPFKGKKVTLSFYVKCGVDYSAVGKVLDVKLQTHSTVGTEINIASNGFPLATNVINQQIALTTSWQKFILTSTTIGNAIEQIGLLITYTPTGTAGVNDYIDIAQVQINVGETALPFMPKSFAQELQDCMRYYQKSYDYEVLPGTATSAGNVMYTVGDNVGASSMLGHVVRLPVTMRIAPTVTFYDNSGAQGKFTSDYASGSSVNGSSSAYMADIKTSKTFRLLVLNASGTNGFEFHYTADAEL